VDPVQVVRAVALTIFLTINECCRPGGQEIGDGFAEQIGFVFEENLSGFGKDGLILPKGGARRP
jgi:hypothetical protein